VIGKAMNHLRFFLKSLAVCNDPVSLPSQEFPNRFSGRFFHQLLEPFFHLVYPYLSAITRAENKVVVDERSCHSRSSVFLSHSSILSVYCKKSNNRKNKTCCFKRPQKRVPSKAAFHPTIETVG
jgi:hypothetical protein